MVYEYTSWLNYWDLSYNVNREAIAIAYSTAWLLGSIIQSEILHKKTDNCQHPKHKEYLVAFLKNYPTANKDSAAAVEVRC